MRTGMGRILVIGIVVVLIVIGVGGLAMLPGKLVGAKDPKVALGLTLTFIFEIISICSIEKDEITDGTLAAMTFLNGLSTALSVVTIPVILIKDGMISGSLFALAFSIVIWWRLRLKRNALMQKRDAEIEASKSPTGLIDVDDPNALSFTVERNQNNAKRVGNESYRLNCESYGRLMTMQRLVYNDPDRDYDWLYDRLDLNRGFEAYTQYFSKIFCNGLIPQRYIGRDYKGNFPAYPPVKFVYWDKR